MIITKELEDGRIEVSSDKGKVDIGCGAVERIIVTKEEVQYVDEVSA